MASPTEPSPTPMVPTHGAMSAWPLLAGLQLALLLVLLGGSLSRWPARTASVTDRLQALDPAQATLAVAQARAAADSGRALAPEAEARTLRFLSLLGQSAELAVLGSRLRPGVARGGAQPVDVVLTLAGDPYHLPIFLDGLHHQRAVNHLLSVQGNGAGTYAEFAVIIRYYRPLPVELSWVPARLAQEAPAHADLAPLLQDALTLAAWKGFQAEERTLLARASRVRREVARAVSPALIGLRRSGGAVHWRYADPADPTPTAPPAPRREPRGALTGG